MKKLIIAVVLLAASWTANAVPVVLVSHQTTSSNGSVSAYITDGSHVSGIAPPSTTAWDWNGANLFGTGFYGATLSINGSPSLPTFLSDQVTNLIIATGTTPGGTAFASSYTCVEGAFFADVGANGCGQYTFGINGIDESTTVWSGTSVSRTLGGDDVSIGAPRSIAVFNFGLDGVIGVNGLTPGDLILLGNGLPVGTPGSEVMTFQVVPVPAAVWLFGSALGLLGWSRRKAV